MENYKPLKKESKKTTEGGKISMLMNLRNQHSKNGYNTESNLPVQCNSHQNPNDIHHKD
jgi:hypothetical protein